MDIPDMNVPSFEHITITAMVEKAERRLDADEPTVIWGSSLGGYLAALLASRQPEKVRCIVLMAPAVDFPKMFPERMRAMCDSWVRGEPVLVRHHAARAELPLAGDLVADCPKWPIRLRISCPILVLAARNDEVIPLDTIEAWTRDQPSAELHVLETDHAMAAVVSQILAYAMPFVGLGRTLPA